MRLINTANLEIIETITPDSIHKKRLQIIKNIANNVKIDGFRKGKIPQNFIENKYKDEIQRDTQKELLASLIETSLTSLNISSDRVIGNPLIKKFDQNENGISVEMLVGLFPEFEINDYLKFIPEFEISKPSDKDIESRLERISKEKGKLIEVDRALENGDVANIDFEGFIDGEAFSGGKGENFDLEIGSKKFIDSFEEQLVGMKKGETRDVNVVFPNDYRAKSLASKNAKFIVKLNKIQIIENANIDDELAKTMFPSHENASLEYLKDYVKDELTAEAKNEKFSTLKLEVVKNLLEGINFDIPDSVVESELDVIFRNHIQNLSKEDLKELQNNKEKAKEKRESFRKDAIDSVKLTFIIDFIAKKEDIKISNDELYQSMYYESIISGKPYEEVLKFYEDNYMIPALKMTLLENKVLNNMLESKCK